VTCLWLRPLLLWLTINPINYEDPITQIFAGEDINIDAFCSMIGPSSNKRAENMARDPFAVTTLNYMLYRACTRVQY
jgi:hypothetical protein